MCSQEESEEEAAPAPPPAPAVTFSDDDDDLVEKQPTGGDADDDADDDDDVGDLFGSDDEDDGGAFEEAAASAEPSAEPVEFELPNQPRPAKDAKLFLVRLPNILKFQPRPFDPDTFNEEEDNNEGEGEEGGSRKAANVIRWRETATGGRESNTRLVKWSDGTMTLHVGGEALKAQQIALPAGSTHLYAMPKGGHLECHGIITHKLALAPTDRKSATHQALSREIAKSHTKAKSRMQVISTTENPEEQKKKMEQTFDDKKRLEARQANRRMRANSDMDGPSLTADFLDDDDDNGLLEGNLGALKRGFKAGRKRASTGLGIMGGKKKRSGGSYASGGKRRRAGLYTEGGSESDGSYGENEEDSGEEEAEPGEMEGFIVGETDDEESAEEEEEAVMSDEDDDDDDGSEEEYGKKKKKGKKGKAKAKKKKSARLVDEDDD